MDFLVLTKTGGVFGPIAEVLGWIMEALFAFTEIFGIVNIGLCIILFTLVTKLILFPLTLKQQKSSKIMAVMQPEIQAIQKKYKDKKDNESMMKMNVETREVYEKYGTSMTGGCLPLLIQLPIMLALYQVIYKIPAYVHSVRQYFDLIIEKLPAGFASSDVFMSLAESYALQNADYTDSRVCSFLEIGVTYESDIGRAKQLLAEEIARQPDFLDVRTPEQIAEGAPLVQVVVLALAESSVTLRASLWAKDNGTAFSLKCTVQENIKKIYEQEGIGIAYPHLVVVSEKV